MGSKLWSHKEVLHPLSFPIEQRFKTNKKNKQKDNRDIEEQNQNPRETLQQKLKGGGGFLQAFQNQVPLVLQA